jgi:hypothetical protein
MSKNKEDNTGNPTSQNVSFRSLLLISIAVVLIQVLVGILVYLLLPNWSDRANFGDMFGAVSTLFSGLAFAGVIYAIFLQRRELELQRYELEMTREELKRSAQAQEKSEVALREQAEAMVLTAQINSMSLIPAIYTNVNIEDSKVFFEILNIGDTLSFDLDVLAIGIYNGDEIEASKFISEYVDKTESKLINRLFDSEDGFYGVYDHVVYAVLPSRRKVIASFEFPLPPFGIFFLLQFRDMRGNNYHQLSDFWETSDKRGVISYRLTSMEPKTPIPVSRVTFNGIDLKLETEDSSVLPEYMSEFARNWNASIPAGYTKSGFPDVEGRGEWRDI